MRLKRDRTFCTGPGIKNEEELRMNRTEREDDTHFL